MCAPCVFHRLSIDNFWSGPTLRTAQDQHRPCVQDRVSMTSSLVLNGLNFIHYCIQSSSHELMHRLWFVPLDKIRLPAVAREELGEFLVIHPAKQGRICDLVTIEMENGQHGTVTCRIQKFIAMPARGQWSRFRFAVSHHAACKQVWVIEHRAASVHDRITQFSTLVDGPRRFGCCMARNSSGKGKLLEQPLYALFILRDVGIKLAIGAFQVCIRDHSGSAVAGTSNIDDIQVVFLNQAIEMDVDEVQTWRGSPVS